MEGQAVITFHPTLPVLVAIVGALALALCVWQLVAARGRRIAWLRRSLLVALAIAMAFRPALPGGEVPTASISARVFVVVDTSQSVAAEDWGSESRLAGMQEDVVEIARSFAGADISVISFDSQALLRVPLTDDGSAVIEMVRALRPEIAQQSRGTSVAAAHDLLRTELERSAAADPGSPAIVFYLGDGEHTAEEPPQSFADLGGLVDRGLVLGYGTEQGGRMRVSSFNPNEDRYLQDPAGGDAVSRIDEGQLQSIASELGISYLHRQPGLPLSDALGPMAALDGAANLDRTEEARLEVAWILGLPIALLLAWEGLSLARSLRSTRGILPTEAP
ncbi:VWA domain-containing protein [Agrococcus sp. Marseille-Q4369]|uniref:VWA domain-containing protein n=1 Tax=Agrococcus sp. Marseille-Q4369 TaxID=2810513 RepID=UPI001B8AAF76|nr:VWA domain-containing protein [Agrococcus sp. Marseille-Q4369]QUW19604.1 VWA domain-containing protein [Agrococcus sp. Marseille-Q4369]